jgi:hypothetical protein
MAAPAAAASFDNSSAWHNFTAWTAEHWKYAVNVSKYAPSLEDLVWAGPRMVMKLGSFISLPDSIDGLGQRTIPEATGASIFQTVASTTASAAMADAVVPQGAGADQDPAALVSKLSMDGAKGLGSVFSYATSKWALCCIAMAIILNRTHIFAATRRRLRLRWQVRLMLRCLPIGLFVFQARRILQSMQCQTSPDFAEMRWGDASKSSELMFSHASTFLHGLSSTLLLAPTDVESCRAVNMIPPGDNESRELRGSLSLLWPLFGTFCLSQFLETVSCAVQGRPVAAETGMTLFEHSLAFAEADAAISNHLGWGLFTNVPPTEMASTTLGSSIAISRSMIMRRVNTPPEILLVAFLSAMSHLTSHILGIFNLQAKFRLVSTGFWGLCFMGSILWSAFTFSLDDPSSQGLLRYPTVCIVGFIPHVLVLGGILVCFLIYALALGLSALAPPDAQQGGGSTFRERMVHAHGNMQANISLSDIRITMEMDFYTALLRTGFGAITMASEAVYLNEDRDVNLKRHTWLEDERYREIEELRMQWIGAGMAGSRYETIGTIGLVPVKDGQIAASNGYARERAAQKVPKARSGERRMRDGVGAAERSGRWLMALEFLMKINRLLLKGWAIASLKVLSKLGFRTRPSWLVWLVRRPKLGAAEGRTGPSQRSQLPQESITVSEGSILIPRHEHIDVELELRRRLNATDGRRPPLDEYDFDGNLYKYWLRGGFWGATDSSGDYVPEDLEDDFDTTSLISFAPDDSESEWVSEDEGQKTPTPGSPRLSREASPFLDTPLQMNDLARLLHPSSPEEREDARALSAHLNSDRILTRSHYYKMQQLQRTQVLHPARSGPIDPRIAGRAGKLSPDEEAQLLEQLLLSRRAAGAPHSQGTASWESGAAGLGPDGPQCVVCQSSPRTIIVWPCRCLSLCDDCRVSLAMNNFDKCVCCRREVISFSRIYVP